MGKQAYLPNHVYTVIAAIFIAKVGDYVNFTAVTSISPPLKAH
ncbi:Adenosylhomocysteinase-S-adenosyl-L-homocysteine hydrolase [Moritella viscosa]|uniref:Adenosylhomocysteinase-S-adenosyl-L-homocysteine hydrolase n=1 Tax=Moritella viscosa TaxID=80854 RepID=A0A1K9ZSV1_9GAMM|nr:Adenosylhomocysteinase-S-adenosyl-L-homocysteine hydrolase [Moritella viscosa]SGY96169.1 Adenosylhomocysteinase-S-adenosyl-L-homocysteine hydrolase [Moritella viscosa]SGY96577.1 Adenosylhomocysteinase-S-adenosyl-L-homocysteine hydrolase [Moritella viscosa]SGZ01694.1 Adenosylhomocysteinase-S-adenosyl-L-homocysteine hydrolase [Moritella viscosa]SGZ02135.1 Adenosylhomocysteinase-S-adenosyl-L-homocysteine hydrolase [Moritella viscosa]